MSDLELKTDLERKVKEIQASSATIKSIEPLIQERGKTHGAFSDHARITQRLKFIIREEELRRKDRGQAPLTHMQRESLEMILHKIGRIVAGEASFADHWDDIAGYAHIANKEI